MGLIDNARTALVKWTGAGARDGNPLAFEDWLSYFRFNGLSYPFMSGGTQGEKQEVPSQTFEGFVQQVYKTNGVIFAVMLTRFLIFSEARFQYRRMKDGRPGDLFGDEKLSLLEKPWPLGTTGDLLARMLQDADLAGNAYIARRSAKRLARLRPDWVTLVCGSPDDGPESEDPTTLLDIDAEVVGLIYHRGGRAHDPVGVPILPGNFAHFAPIPDPTARFRGMSWITPIIREVLGDNAATTHKLRFFENAATPNLAVSLDKSIGKDAFEAFVKKMKEQHEGVLNAYRTLYLAGGATATVVGANMRQVDFKVTQGAGETRIAAAAGVPPVMVGLSEGLSAATYSNYAQARRRLADGTLRPLWRNCAGSLAAIIDVPKGAELWYDDRDIAFLREDLKDRADIAFVRAQTIRQLIDAGYDPKSVVKAVEAEDYGLLMHTGLFSVQLQAPGTKAPTTTPSGGDTPPALPKPTDQPALPAPTPAASREAEGPTDPLTEREREFVDLVSEGLTNKEIATRAHVSERTVERALSSAMRKTDTASRSELAVWIAGALDRRTTIEVVKPEPLATAVVRQAESVARGMLAIGDGLREQAKATTKLADAATRKRTVRTVVDERDPSGRMKTATQMEV